MLRAHKLASALLPFALQAKHTYENGDKAQALFILLHA
jgi:hypothetical protein